MITIVINFVMQAQISNISEASGLDDFAHLGLITDLLE